MDTLPADIFGQFGTAKRSYTGNERIDLRGVAHDAAAGIDLDRARSHRVHADIARSEIMSQVAGHHFDCSLERRIGNAVGIDEARDARREIHNLPTVAQQRQQLRGQKNGPAKLTRYCASRYLGVTLSKGAWFEIPALLRR